MTIINRTPQLKEVCEHLRQCGVFALDMEFIPERTYSTELCLVQVAAGDGVFIIDPIAIRDLSPVWELIASPEILKVLHAADQDLDLAFTASGLVPQNIMDTQLAAGFTGLGYPIGYGKLLQQVLGITISKSESYTDWTNRPLSEPQLEYARNDVRHLLEVHARLVERLEEIGRLEWVREECRKYCDERYYERNRNNDYFRVKGASSLDRRGLAVLRELCSWRHGEAARANRPVRAILQDGILLEFARRPPERLADIQRIRGMRPDQLKQYGSDLLDAVRTGLDLPDGDLPHYPEGRVPSKREQLLVDVMLTMLKILSLEHDVATELIGTRSMLEALVRQHAEGAVAASTLPILQTWRHDIAGRMLLEFLDGAAVHIQSPFPGKPIKMQVLPAQAEADKT